MISPSPPLNVPVSFCSEFVISPAAPAPSPLLPPFGLPLAPPAPSAAAVSTRYVRHAFYSVTPPKRRPLGEDEKAVRQG